MSNKLSTVSAPVSRSMHAWYGPRFDDPGIGAKVMPALSPHKPAPPMVLNSSNGEAALPSSSNKIPSG
jgi:hypothetical protein